MEAYDGPQIVGMDLHRRRSVLVRMTEDDRCSSFVCPLARVPRPVGSAAVTVALAVVSEALKASGRVTQLPIGRNLL